jgi:hypothetical protein
MGTIHLNTELEPSPETPYIYIYIYIDTIYISQTMVNMHNITGLMIQCYTNYMELSPFWDVSCAATQEFPDI